MALTKEDIERDFPVGTPIELQRCRYEETEWTPYLKGIVIAPGRFTATELYPVAMRQGEKVANITNYFIDIFTHGGWRVVSVESPGLWVEEVS